jgi:hypothetical protein
MSQIGTTTSNAITVITPIDLQNAGGVLAQNINYVSIYQKKYDVLLAQANKEGVKLTEETDKKINDFLVSAKACVSNMETQRKPYTSKAQEFVKLFTNQENILSQVLAPVLQAKRNASATAYAKEKALLEAKAKLKLAQDTDRINLLADAEQQIRNAYLDILNSDKGELLHAFETADISTIDGVEDLLTGLNPVFSEDIFNQITPVISSNVLDDVELQEIVKKATEGKFDKIKQHYHDDIKQYGEHLLSLIPERRDEIAKGLESATAQELKTQQAENLFQMEQQTDQVVEVQTNQKLSEVITDYKIETSKIESELPKISAIETFNINVLKREGWAEIFKFYFTHSPEVDLGKIKLDQMKAFAEKLAKSQNIKIQSDALEYEVQQKATNRKTKEHALPGN